MRVLCTFLFVTAGCAAAPKGAIVAQAPPPIPAVARVVDIELTDTSASGTSTKHYLLSVVDDQGWSRLSERTMGLKLELRAASNRRSGFMPAIVRVDLVRNLEGTPDIAIEQSTIFFAGKRTVLGHVEGSNGATEIAMVMR